MKLIVVSDSHRDISSIRDIYYKFVGADYFIHLGDSEVDKAYLHNYLYIKGNCDYFLDAPSKKDLIILNELKIHLEHGNLIPWNNIEDYLNKLNNPDIFLFGHTHKIANFKINNTLFLNPGSLSRPRDSHNGSYLIINIENITKEINYEFKRI